MARADPSLFSLGQKVVTANARAVLNEAGVDAERLFARHAAGDWGIAEGRRWYANRLAVDVGYGFIASAYSVLGDVHVVVVTQPDCSGTLMALPRELRERQGGDE